MKKKCKFCQKSIDHKATVCPFCQSDLRNWFIKHPIITTIIGLYLFVFMTLNFSKNIINRDYYPTPTKEYNPTPTKQEEKLTISSHKIGEKYGRRTIVGEIFNPTSYKAKFIKVIVTLYNEKNEVVGTDSAYAELDSLSPNESTPFEILINEETPKFIDYNLSASWRAVY